jgi:amino acid adenylation domain-containing protein
MLLPPELLKAATALGQRERASLFMVLAAAFNAMMARYTGQADLAIGTPIANRRATAVEGLIGTFVNTLVFRTDVSGNPTFRTLLGRIRGTALDAFANQDLSFERLVSELQPARETNRSPLFQILFNVQNARADVPRLPGVRADLAQLPREATQFDLTISIDTELAGRFHCAYNPDLFDAEKIEAMFDHYRNILEHVTRTPDVPLSDLTLMGSAERTRMLREWNDTRDERGFEDTVLTLFQRQSRTAPSAIAVQCGDTSLTYAELDERSDRIAGYLQARGAGPETLVGICLDRSVDLLVTLLGVLKAGAAYLPLDPAFPAERLAFMIEDSAAPLIVTETRLRHLLPAATQASIVRLDVEAEAIDAADATGERSPADGGDLAYVLYTSGSTGRPKGVQITHRSLANLLLSMQREPGMTASDRLLSVTTLSFDIAGLELFLPLVTGARVCLATREDATDPARLAGLIEAGAITMMQATPATWRMLLEDGWAGRPELTILCGGEAMPRDLAAQLLPRARTVWNMYGPTETTIWSTVERVSAGDEPVSIGRPIANTEVYVLDRQLQPVPAGMPGELYIGGDGVARGYLNRPDLTAERFVRDPFSGRQDARIYRTGDLARFLRDGRLECLGRLDQQIKLRGFRIELGEIEAVLTSHDAVAAAVVTLRTDHAREPRLVGYVVPAAGSNVEVDALRTYLRERLPSYMVPSQVVELDRLPLTPNGKADRAALPAPPPPAGASSPSQSATSPAERVMAGIWAELLNVPEVRPDDDFFELGGHSLLAVRLMSRIEKAFGRKLALATLFEARTVRQLAEIVDGRRERSAWVSLVPVQTSGSKPPFFCVHSVGGEVLVYSALAARLAPDQPFIAFRASGYDADSEPLRSIEEQAALYIREMIAFDPLGPYYIGGYSHGGRVALEMALQLKAQGKTVAFLGIIDTTPCRLRVPALSRFLGGLRNLPLWFWYDACRSPIRQHLDRAHRLGRRLSRRLLACVWRREGSSAHSALDDMMTIEQLPAWIQELYRSHHAAFVRYRPTRRCGDVTVFRALGQPLMSNHEPDLGWKRVSDGTVDVRHVTGNHSSVVQEPDVQHLATELRAALENAQARAAEERAGDAAESQGRDAA